ncbi:hypothetical protein U1Q18_032975 [Sarracenia purpurea var. burkii]
MTAPPPGFFHSIPSSSKAPKTVHLPSLASSIKLAHHRIDDLYHTVIDLIVNGNILEEKVQKAPKDVKEVKETKQEITLMKVIRMKPFRRTFGKSLLGLKLEKLG